MPSNTELTIHLLVQITAILAACRITGLVLRRVGQTQVAADMVAGFLLGPTLLGAALPGVFHWLFPASLVLHGTGGQAVTITHPAMTVLYELGQLGLVLYMFLVGLSFNTAALVGHVRRSVVVSLTGVAVPVLLGGVLGWVLAGRHDFFPAGIAHWQGALFFGSALAITSFPMLARIIYESGLSGTRIGTVALACAAFDDAVAGILLAVVISTATGNPAVAAIALGGTVGYVLVMVGPGRHAARRLARWARRDREVRPEALVVVTGIVLLCAALTEQLGVYAVFGAFVAGTVLPRGELTGQLRRWLEPTTVYLLLPMFFVYAGLNTRLSLLLTPSVAVVLAGTILVAFTGKAGACYLACRVQRFGHREAASLAVLMNARGLMELILLSIGLEKHLITPATYTVLAVMTVVTTLATSPLYQRIQRRGRPPARADGTAGDERAVPRSMAPVP